MKILVRIAIALFLLSHSVTGTQILAKSQLKKCEKVSDELNCTSKIVLNLAVPSESSGREASMVAEIVEAEENSTNQMQTLRSPPVIAINKSSVYALYELTYIRDVAYKPQELYVRTRKCRTDAGGRIVTMCERLRDENGNIIEDTRPTCCPCGNQRRVPSSCGNFFDKLTKGKANTAHCLRFTDEWFHVFSIGQRSIGFSIRIEIKTGSKTSEVVVGPQNRVAVSEDKFLRVNLIGDYVGYINIPSFDNFYLVIPREGGAGQPQILGNNFSKWMLLERVRFTLDGLQCDKIGVGYKAFNAQPNFCAGPYWSCLHNQLWNFWEADQNRISRNQVPLYCVQGRFERINQHPNAGSHAFSIGITEVLNTNLMVELSADDIEYVFQRSDGKILGITVPTFEALTQFGTATVTTKNVGEVEASYSLTFDCSLGVNQMEEQFYIMKPDEVVNRSFKLYPTSDQAAKYACSAILKDAEFNEVDRAECEFTTTATVLDNESQISSPPPKTGANGFFDYIEETWNKLWFGMADFITGESCRRKCSGFFDISCHIQYICLTWLLMFGLFLAIFPTVVVLLWLLHQRGLFDPIYDWWEDHIWKSEKSRDRWKHYRQIEAHPKEHHRHGKKHHRHNRHNLRKGESGSDYNYILHHVHKDNKHSRHGRVKHNYSPGSSAWQAAEELGKVRHHRKRKERISLTHTGNHHPW
ncbi:protein HAPLESS 2 [Andrographis paniculata]|uniref:protein HAPLESS 2 n=1 Tax=Andrographis paniculata TaxID=175694 RepID=UPI0021E6FA96|nr:protein HAPLESS 2 [Andrographis paniculata]